MILIITKPVFFAGEGERIGDMLMGDEADKIHIRKPGAGMSEMERLLQSIPSELYPRLVMHDCFRLAVSYGVGGIHLNRRNTVPPCGWEGQVSISCHSLEELEECRKKSYDYMSLSPIFDSISKKGYHSMFTREQLMEARRKGIIDHRVMALGGVTFARVEEVMAMGFGGAMILGDAWR